ncbi:MAG TPA: hypothetical protein ENF73_03385, partial [Proteobacteria bacterium]|nr:hypothetical protein [Pseudomonadota bacterium]
FHADVPRLIEGGVDAVGWGLVVNPFTTVERRIKSVWRYVHAFRRLCRRSNGKLRHILSPDDLAVENGRTGAFLGIDGAHALGDRLELVETYYRWGVRYITLVHFSSNAAAHPAQGWGSWRTGAGLTEFGRAVIAECRRVGMMVDLAHINKTGFMEAARLIDGPFIVSHSGASAVARRRRLIDDEQLKAVADNDGVVGIISATYWTSGKLFDDVNAMIGQIDYVARTIGIDHVCLGSDMDGFLWVTVRGIQGVEDYPLITEMLLRRGYSDEDVQKILGLNFLRVYRAVWDRADKRARSSGPAFETDSEG